MRKESCQLSQKKLIYDHQILKYKNKMCIDNIYIELSSLESKLTVNTEKNGCYSN